MALFPYYYVMDGDKKGALSLERNKALAHKNSTDVDNYLDTRPEASPLMSFSTSSTVTML